VLSVLKVEAWFGKAVRILSTIWQRWREGAEKRMEEGSDFEYAMEERIDGMSGEREKHRAAEVRK
jgi:hypothetical protein